MAYFFDDIRHFCTNFSTEFFRASSTKPASLKLKAFKSDGLFLDKNTGLLQIFSYLLEKAEEKLIPSNLLRSGKQAERKACESTF
jgi:hypothetical protein